MALVNSLEEMAVTRPNRVSGHVLAFDPGETTGFAHFKNFRLVKAFQLDTSTVPLAYESLKPIFLFLEENEAQIVAEDYRIYDWKAKDHSWSAVHTVKVVGLIEMFCHIHDVFPTLRLAQQAKQFMTDDKLRAWGLWKEGQKHARDAIRHGAYHIIFGQGAA